MTLIQVLDKFPTEINQLIESIKYDDGDDCYKITATFAIEDDPAQGEWQYVSIILFDSGSTMLYVKGDGIDGETAPWIWDNVIDFYVKVRNIWKNVV